ncbi:tRNA (cytosine(38)-C(5))-methyltransferase [Plutella xylostella]|uniref:tRNA (cytosine(38)-C(5))-methyltransferase n=1 Tax=Plutella xylostella TaxID=51655 RepID=UPI0020323F33|nr:tRNA (cytosine(38)-C(5))-methyltransferase [Plutella xylostella]
MNHRILELYSGIGGMHCAWKESGLPGEVAAAVDINTVANEVYKHNFPETKSLTRNIQTLTKSEIEKLNVDTILMSPPCQPFTRNGKYLDEEDPRTNSLLAILQLLEELNCIEYILLENVKGFECSSVRNKFIEALKKCGFEFQEFLLSPSSIGIPNSRLRYYCTARRTQVPWNYQRTDEIVLTLDRVYPEPDSLENILDPEAGDEYLLPDKYLKRANCLDICYKDSKRSCCFTKAYSHYLDGTGSVFTPCSQEMVESCFKNANTHELGGPDYIEQIKQLKLRFFSPKEVCALMAFPKKYSFPKHITRKQCYRLIGNSVNVKVISELLKILYS